MLFFSSFCLIIVLIEGISSPPPLLVLLHFLIVIRTERFNDSMARRRGPMKMFHLAPFTSFSSITIQQQYWIHPPILLFCWQSFDCCTSNQLSSFNQWFVLLVYKDNEMVAIIKMNVKPGIKLYLFQRPWLKRILRVFSYFLSITYIWS